MKSSRLVAGFIGGLFLVGGISVPAQAEVNEVRAAQQYGLSYLTLMIMEDSKLVEKHAKAAGLGDIKVTWAKLGGPGAMNDALLSGSLDFGTGGALNSMPNYLNTINPNVKGMRDFTGKDKIAVTTIKVSTQALLLQMATAKEFGFDNYGKLDPLTVSMPHPEALVALLAGSGAITAHFASPPFQYQELAKSGVRTVISSYDILGGPSTFNVVWSTSKFRDANPKAFAAFVAAFEEANNYDQQRQACGCRDL